MSAKFALAAFAFCAAAPAAFAEDRTQQHSVWVAYGDLNMTAPAGGKALLVRIEKAARTVCGHAVSNSTLLQRAVDKCRRAAVAAAVRSKDLPTLHLAWSGRYPTMILASR